MRFLIFLALALPACAQGIITTVAGASQAEAFARGVVATDIPLDSPSVAVDAAVNIYAIRGGNLVVKITPAGILTPYAGSGINGFSGDGGPAVAATFFGATSIALDANGNLYIADVNNNRVRKVDTHGVISTLAAGVFPQNISVDRAGNVYIAEYAANAVRRVSPDGVITLIAGNKTFATSGDGGPALAASIPEPSGVAVDSAGNVFIAQHFDPRIRKVTPAGIITSFYTGQLSYPASMTTDSSGNVYIADEGDCVIKRIDASGNATVIAGDGFLDASFNGRFTGDGGPAVKASLNYPAGIAFDAVGNLYIADTVNNRIRKVDAAGIITTVAGADTLGASYYGIGGPARSALLQSPWSAASDVAGNLYIAEEGANRVDRVDYTGSIFAFAGTGAPGFAGDGGPAVAATLNQPVSVAVDAAGSVYVANLGNPGVTQSVGFPTFTTSQNRIRKITPDGLISTFAGATGNLERPYAISFDPAGNLFVADEGYLFFAHGSTFTGNHQVSKISPQGTVSLVAGAGGNGFSGDGGPATAALMYSPRGVAVDAAGNVYISDSGNNRIRKLDTGRVINTVAQAANPMGSAVDAIGNLYFATGNTIDKLTPSGTLSIVAGNGAAAFSGDGGLATAASLNAPTSVSLDADGNLLIADTGNNRVRKVLMSGPSIDAGRVLPAAGYTPGPLAAGSLISIFGRNLAAAPQIAGVRVLIGGIAAPLLYVSPHQINAQIPFETPASSATPVVVEVYGVQSAPEYVQTVAVRPAIFAVAGQPAHPGSLVSIYCTGLGPTLPAVATGAIAPGPPSLAMLPVPPIVFIGGLVASVQYAGLAPGLIGVYQINAYVPDAVPLAADIPVTLSLFGATSNTVPITVR